MACADLSRQALSKLDRVERMTVEYAHAMLLLGKLDVVAVWRVVNEDLDLQYAVAVSGAAEEREVRVLHGTTQASVESIMQHGFKVGGVDAPAKSGTALECGIYLTTDAAVAALYSFNEDNRYIILAELCVTKEYLKKRPTASAFNSADEVFSLYVQPDKTLVRPLYAC